MTQYQVNAHHNSNRIFSWRFVHDIDRPDTVDKLSIKSFFRVVGQGMAFM